MQEHFSRLISRVSSFTNFGFWIRDEKNQITGIQAFPGSSEKKKETIDKVQDEIDKIGVPLRITDDFPKTKNFQIRLS